MFKVFYREHVSQTQGMREGSKFDVCAPIYPREGKHKKLHNRPGEKKREEIKTLMAICKRKSKLGKRKPRDSSNTKLINYEYPVELPFCFEFYQNSSWLLRRSHLMACVILCNSEDAKEPRKCGAGPPFPDWLAPCRTHVSFHYGFLYDCLREDHVGHIIMNITLKIFPYFCCQ